MTKSFFMAGWVAMLSHGFAACEPHASHPANDQKIPDDLDISRPMERTGKSPSLFFRARDHVIFSPLAIERRLVDSQDLRRFMQAGGAGQHRADVCLLEFLQRDEIAGGGRAV